MAMYAKLKGRKRRERIGIDRDFTLICPSISLDWREQGSLRVLYHRLRTQNQLEIVEKLNLYCIALNVTQQRFRSLTEPKKTSLVCELSLIVFVHCESRRHVLLTWQASMQIYWNNNSSNDKTNKEENKTKNSLRKELYRVVFLILTVKLLYQFLPENVLFYHDLHTVNNTKKARKEKKVVEYRSC